MKTLLTLGLHCRRSACASRRPLRALGLLALLFVLGSVPCPWDATAQTPPLTIQPSTGNVGIKNTNPDPNYALDVTGTVNATNFKGDGSQLTNLPGGVWTTNGTTISYSAGNVGIGTTTPVTGLHIVKTPPQGSPWIGSLLVEPATHPWSGALSIKSTLASGAPNRVWSLLAGYAADAPASLRILDSTAMVDRLIIDVDGNVFVSALYASVKNFQIPHPLDPERKLLTHSALEGPEVGVTYRGEAYLKDGEATVALPPYFEALTRKEQRTVQLTPVAGWSPLYVATDVREGTFVVRTAKGGDPTQRFYWEVRAVRADVEPLQVERDAPADSPTRRIGVPGPVSVRP